MRVRICYTVEVNDRFRRALNNHYGKPGLATRAEIQAHYEACGSSTDDDLMWDLDRQDKDQARTRCEGCGLPIPEPGEEPDPDALLCDSCLRDRESDGASS